MYKTINTLEYNNILEMLCENALSDRAKQKLSELQPFINEREAKSKMRETTESREILDTLGNPPLAPMKEIDKIMTLTEKGSMLLPEQLTSIAQFISSCKRLKSYLKKAEILDVGIAFYGSSMNDLSDLYDEIDLAIRNNMVDSSASSFLRDIRRKIENTNQQIKSKLDSMLKGRKEFFSDGYVVTRNGHFVLPVKKEYKNQVSGSVIDTSATGSTYFIEPTAVSKLQEELSVLKISEENEIRKILYTLTALVDANSTTIYLNIEAMETLDIIFAKAKLSSEMRAIPVPITTDRKIKIIDGRHPLLKTETCVPLNFEIGNGINGVVITGPNTGGKTVALKTIGLLSLMAQSGLHVPVVEGSKFCMHNIVLCDIGDGQSITENLSTFSAHITNIISILNTSNEESLVLLDELGSGTDPVEGMGIAIAVLEELRIKNCLFIATTHYPEVKEFAAKADGIINAKMTFDRESLKPLYKLEIGEAGESCALYIAKRLGLPQRMLECAYNEAYCRGICHNIAEIPDFALMENDIEEEAKISSPIIQAENLRKPVNTRSSKFNIGDSVIVYPQKNIGIVYKKANPMGEIGIQIQGKKQLINHKRIQLKTPSSELYPNDYDFSIVFESVENRKARHQMGRKHQPNLEIKLEDNK